MRRFEETEAHFIVSDGNSSVISRHTVLQIMSHYPVYALLRRQVAAGMGRTIPMYSVSAAGEGYVAQMSANLVMKPVDSEDQLMKVVGHGIVTDLKSFIPMLGVPVDSDGVETLFFWLDTKRPPPEKMVALKASERPEQVGPDGGTRGALVGAVGDSRLVNILVRQIGSTFVFKYHCLLCQCPVSGRNRCSRCRAAAYCDAECQRADWPRHRAECTK